MRRTVITWSAVFVLLFAGFGLIVVGVLGASGLRREYGTAAVVVPIAELKGEGVHIGSPAAEGGELTMSLRAELTDIQYGRRPDVHGWMTRLDA